MGSPGVVIIDRARRGCYKTLYVRKATVEM